MTKAIELSVINSDNADLYRNKLRDCFSYCAFVAPMMGAISFYVSRKVVTTKDFIAMASPTAIYVGEGFFSLSKREQAFVALHEILHVALQHRTRGVRLQASGYSHDLVNVAADLIVNNILECLNKEINDKIEMPKSALVFKKVLPKLDPTEYSLLSIEEVCALLISEGKKGSESGDKSKPTQGDLKEGGTDLEDCVVSEDNPNTVEVSSSSELEGIWEQRVEQASRSPGDQTGDLIKSLLSSLPKVETDWRLLTRSLIGSAINKSDFRSTYKKPSRRTLAKVTSFHEPGKQKKKGSKTVIAFIDLSGSCYTPEIIEQFVANLCKIQSSANCTLMIATFDTEITDFFKTDELKAIYKTIEWKGGGGTDFRCLFSKDLESKDGKVKILKKDIAAYVVMTDLEGPVPDRPPSVPVIWSGLASDRDFLNRVPFGVGVLMK